MKYYSIFHLIWTFCFGLSVFFQDDIQTALWLLTSVWWMVLLATGTVLVAWSFKRLMTAPSAHRVAWAQLALIPVVLVLATQLAGSHWVRVLRFQLDKGRYEAQVARILALPQVQRQNIVERNCLIDLGPPLRIAFVQSGGLQDNFSAIVYDPTGIVMEANLFRHNSTRWLNPSLDHVRRLFGGDLNYAEPLGGYWYLCGFT